MRDILLVLSIGIATLALAGHMRWKSPGENEDLTTVQLAELALKGIVTIEPLDKNHDEVGVATGFYISEHVIVTSEHVVSLGKSIRIRKIYALDEMIEASVITVSRDTGLALIYTPEGSPHFLKLGDLAAMPIGSPVFTAGNPGGFVGTVSNGILSNVETVKKIEHMVFTAPVSPGNSGGPVLDNHGKVIGIVAFGVDDTQNLNFAISAKYVVETLKSASTATAVKGVEWDKVRSEVLKASAGAGGSGGPG